MLFFFVLSLAAGSYSGLLALGALAAVLAAFVGVIYLFYVGFSPAVAAAVVAAGAGTALVIKRRRRRRQQTKEEKSTAPPHDGAAPANSQAEQHI